MLDRGAALPYRIIDQAMVDMDHSVFTVNIFPTEAQRFPDPASCTQQYGEQRPPVEVHRMVGDMFHKGPLLSYRQSVAYSAMLVRIFLNLCQYPICGIVPDDA